MEVHPLKQDLDFIEKEFQEIMKKLPSLRGKDKGMAHKDLSRCKKDRMDIEKGMIKSILDSADVICATTIGSGHKILGNRRFPVVLIDEATQATEPSTLVPICRSARQLILVGDHAQLSPTVISKEAEEKGLGFSLFERLHKLGVESTMLKTQYRMHPTIREFPSSRFYDGKLDDGCTKSESHPLQDSFGLIGTSQSHSYLKMEKIPQILKGILDAIETRQVLFYRLQEDY